MTKSFDVTGVRPRTAVPSGGPIVTVPAVRESDGLPARLFVVTTELDSALRRRIREESADTEALLARIDESVVLPLLEHGLDAGGRPYLLAAEPGPSLDEVLAAEGPLPLKEILAAARAAATGLNALAEHRFIGSPPPICRTPSGAMVLTSPLPPTLIELQCTLDNGTGHEPPEVLTGRAWTPSGQVYACASMLWTLVAGRPAYPKSGPQRLARLLGEVPGPIRGAEVPDALMEVLRSALAADPADRPEDPQALAAALQTALGSSRGDAIGAVDEPPTLPPGHAAVPPFAPHAVSVGASHIRPAEGRPFGSLYWLDTKIGSGATGHVWAGRRREDDSPVAVKLLRAELADEPDVVDRFVREKTLLKRLRHANLVRVHDLVTEGDAIGIVMDLVPGSNLRQAAATGTMDHAEAACLLAQTAEAIAAVHEAGIVHRDVKPQNILVTERSGRRIALLSDFGIARAIDGSAHTQLIGTPAYSAPELAAGRPPTPAVDIYSLGITGYELFSGRPPFASLPPEALMRAHLEEPVPRPDGIADDAWALIEACLQKHPAARPSAVDVAERWSAIADSLPMSAVPVPAEADPAAVGAGPSSVDHSKTTGTVTSARRLTAAPEKPPAPRSGRRYLPAAAAGVALMGVGIGVVLAVQTRPERSPRPAAPSTTASTTYTHPVPASVSPVGLGMAKLTWSPNAGNLPGFKGFVVSQVGGETVIPISGTLPRNATSFVVHDVRVGRKSCYMVAAVAVAKPPSAVLPPPTCITVPDLSNPGEGSPQRGDVVAAR